MPKSKRAKVVHLSKVEKKTKEHSQKIFDSIRAAAEQYQYCWVFEVDNMRNNHLKDIREDFSQTSRIFFGKTKVMAKALGDKSEDEVLPNTSDLSKYLHGQVGLFFTHQPPDEIREYFRDYVQIDFARAGVPANMDVVVPEGVVYSRGGQIPQEEDVPLVHSIEVSLRSWGMPTKLERGKVMLDNPYTICTEGQELNSHQTALLKMFGIPMAEFRVKLIAFYDSSSSTVTEIGT